MPHMTRCGVSFEAGLLKKLDAVVAHAGFRNRSAALREIIRAYLVSTEWSDGDEEMAGVVSLVFHRRSSTILRALSDIKAAHRAAVIGDTFHYLHDDYTINILVLYGQPRHVRAIADKCLTCRGVVHGTITPLTPRPPCA